MELFFHDSEALDMRLGEFESMRSETSRRGNNERETSYSDREEFVTLGTRD
jgi:hypothetical protein